jgi:hypothetical protein
MVSPQERHTRVGVLSAKGGERSIAGVEGVRAIRPRHVRLLCNRRERYRRSRLKLDLFRRLGLFDSFIARVMSNPILIRTMGSAKDSSTSGG